MPVSAPPGHPGYKKPGLRPPPGHPGTKNVENEPEEEMAVDATPRLARNIEYRKQNK